MEPQTLPLVIEPGIYSEGSDRVAMNRWRRGNRVRFHSGFAEKLGGWVREQLEAPPYGIGVPRSTRDWNRLDGVNVVAVGTYLGAYVWIGDTFADITPVAKASTGVGGTEAPLTDPFTTVNGSSLVTVAHVGHGLGEEALVTFSGATTVGGLDLNGHYRVTSVVDTDSYTITASNAASADATGGGAVEYVYRLNPGGIITTPGVGYGVGPYGAEAYGTPRTIAGSGQPVVALRARVWSLQNWGEDLILAPRGGGVYRWDSSALPAEESQRIANAPYETLGVVMSPRDRHLIAYGCTPEAAGPTDPLDPLVIRWCSQNNYDEWASSATTTAGELRIEQGTEILQGYLSGNDIIFHTEVASYRMFATQTARVFGLLGIGEAGSMGPQSGVAFQNRAYWMAPENFYTYLGSLTEIPCDVHRAVFDDFNFAQRDLVVAGINRRFSEVIWHYPSKNSLEIDRYVAYDVVAKTWNVGELDRPAWYGNAVRFPQPYGFAPDGTMYVHEVGHDADGAPLGDWIETYDLMLPKGQGVQGRPVMRVNSLAQDFGRLDSSVLVTPQYRKWVGEQVNPAPPVTVSWDPVRKTAGEIRRRGRGRYVNLRIESGGFPGDWKLGSLDVNVQEDGSF